MNAVDAKTIIQKILANDSAATLWTPDHQRLVGRVQNLKHSVASGSGFCDWKMRFEIGA